MLPAFIQYGVDSAEATLASLLGVPRQFSTPFADQYKTRHGDLQPDGAGVFREFVENADVGRWTGVVASSSLAGKITPEDARTVFRQMQGMSG